MIETKKMDLFDVPRDNAILAHACNCLGVWGSGIARVFREKYPDAAEKYREICERDGKSLLGSSLIVTEADTRIGCLFTSFAFGGGVDTVEQILESSRLAIVDMFELALIFGVDTIYSNKFNSGLFNVPWYKTEEILSEISEKYPDISWIVCDWP